MGMGLTTTSTQVTISGGIDALTNISVPDATQTSKSAYGQSNGTTSVTLYTPTAAKTFYLKEISVVNSDASARTLIVYKNDGSTPLIHVKLSPLRSRSIQINGEPYTNAAPLIIDATAAGASNFLNVVANGVEQ